MDFNWCWKKGISASRFNEILALAPPHHHQNLKQPAFLVTNIFDHIEMMPVRLSQKNASGTPQYLQTRPMSGSASRLRSRLAAAAGLMNELCETGAKISTEAKTA